MRKLYLFLIILLITTPLAVFSAPKKKGGTKGSKNLIEIKTSGSASKTNSVKMDGDITIGDYDDSEIKTDGESDIQIEVGTESNDGLDLVANDDDLSDIKIEVGDSEKSLGTKSGDIEITTSINDGDDLDVDSSQGTIVYDGGSGGSSKNLVIQKGTKEIKSGGNSKKKKK
jgi:hypothetical protein